MNTHTAAMAALHRFGVQQLVYLREATLALVLQAQEQPYGLLLVGLDGRSGVDAWRSRR
jgi:hypothetical protein